MKNILFKNVKYINEKGQIKKVEGIYMSNGKIKKIGHINNFSTFYCMEIDCFGMILLPSFLNSHYHLGETIYKGKFKLKKLEDYITQTNEIAKKISKEDYDKIGKYSVLEMIKNGVGVISAARNWDILKDFGVNGCMGYPFMKSKKLETYYDIGNLEKKIKDLQNKYKKYGIYTGVWIHSLNYFDFSDLKKISEIINKNNLYFTIHISETEKQVQEIKNKFGKTEIELLNEYNLLGEQTNLVHCNYLSKNDLELIEKTKTNITICPLSNFYLNNELCNKDYLKYNINLSIGTDGLATGITGNLLENLLFFIYTNKKYNYDSYLNLITKNSAKILGFDKKGLIKQGYNSDLLFIEDKNYSSLLEIISDYSNIKIKNFLFGEKFLIKNGEIQIKNFRQIEKDFFTLKNNL